MLKAVFLRFIVAFLTTLAVFLLLPGISIQNRTTALGVIVLIAGLNAVLKIILIRFSLGCSILALGPILLVVNTMVLWFLDELKLGIQVDSIWAAFWGGLIISVVSFVMSLLVPDGL